MKTWEHPDGINRAHIDHILLRRKWRNSLRTCRVYSTEAVLKLVIIFIKNKNAEIVDRLFKKQRSKVKESLISTYLINVYVLN